MTDLMDFPLSVFPIPPEVGERQLLSALRSLGFRPGRRRAVRRLETFHDTQDGRLYRAGLSLARSEPGEAWHLLSDSGGCVARGSGEADAPAPDGPVARALGVTTAGRPLVPVLRLHFAGEAVALRGGGDIVARLEVGQVSFAAPWHPGREARARVAAVGIEHRGGASLDPAPALRRLGLAPWPACPVGPGLDLLGLPLPGAPVPPAFHLGPDDDAATAARKVLGRQWFKMDANTEGAVRDLDPEFVHDLRVATRRARAALRVFRGVVEERRSEWYRRELAWLASALGAVRDLDVLAGRMRDHALRVAAPAAVASRIAEVLAARRAPAMVVLERALRGGRYRRLLEALRSGVGVGRGGDARVAGAAPARELAPVRTRAAGKRVERTLREGGERPSAEALHAARIAFKRLRYACEFFADLHDGEARESIRRLVEIQDCLGRHQDAVVAEAVLRDVLNAERASGDADTLVTLGALIQLQRDEAGREREKFSELRLGLPRIVKRVRRASRVGRDGSPPSEPETGRRVPVSPRIPAVGGGRRRTPDTR
ncbi:MAG: CHAD domain-containing protein [Acidobacteriota bacterium]